MRQFSLCTVDLAHHAPRVFEELAAGGCQAYPARQALEQGRTQFGLHALHMAGQCRLRDAELARRARDAAGVGDVHEIADAAKIHGAGG